MTDEIDDDYAPLKVARALVDACIVANDDTINFRIAGEWEVTVQRKSKAAPEAHPDRTWDIYIYDAGDHREKLGRVRASSLGGAVRAAKERWPSYANTWKEHWGYEAREVVDLAEDDCPACFGIGKIPADASQEISTGPAGETTDQIDERRAICLWRNRGGRASPWSAVIADVRDGLRELARHIRKSDERAGMTLVPAAGARPDDIRALGWYVTAHQDFTVDGKVTHVLWAFANEGYKVDGVGPTDAAALNEVRDKIRNHPGNKPF